MKEKWSQFESGGKQPGMVDGMDRERMGRLREEIESMESYDDDADSYVYVVELERDDGEIFFYVGMTIDIFDRMRSHVSNPAKRHTPIAGPEHEYLMSVDFGDEIYDFNCVVEVESYSKREIQFEDNFKEFVREQERKRSFELAIEHDTTNILGGR